MSLLPSLRAKSRSPLLQVIKTSVAVIASWLLCAALFSQQAPIFAAIAALLVVQPSVNQSLLKGIERSIGVILGVVIAYGIGFAFGTSSWVVLVAIVLALVFSWALKLGPGSANQIPISAMLVLSLGALQLGYAVDRILETVIGAVIGLAVNALIVPPVLLQPAHLAVARLARELAVAMERLAASLSSETPRGELEAMLVKARGLRGTRDTAIAAVASGAESLTLNPRRGRHRTLLEKDAELLDRLTILVTRVLGMTRAVRDNYRPSLITDPAIVQIAEELRRAAHDVRLLGRDEVSTATAEIPLLTAPLQILRANEEHWILIGSLLEDLRRVRHEIVGAEE
jgi:uncharacterized membrane protein YgaE (UPF0421/DUF939 family)